MEAKDNSCNAKLAITRHIANIHAKFVTIAMKW